MNLGMRVPDEGEVTVENIRDVRLPTTLEGNYSVDFCTQTNWGCTSTTNVAGGLDGSPGIVKVTAPQERDYCVLTNGLVWDDNVYLGNLGGGNGYTITVGDSLAGEGYIYPPDTYREHQIAAWLAGSGGINLTSGQYGVTVVISIELDRQCANY